MGYLSVVLALDLQAHQGFDTLLRHRSKVRHGRRYLHHWESASGHALRH